MTIPLTFNTEATRRRNTYNGKLYKEDTTIFAWDLLNEPRQSSGDISAVQNWIDIFAPFIKSQDPNHMVRHCVVLFASQKFCDLMVPRDFEAELA